MREDPEAKIRPYRDRIVHRLAELSRMLEDPTPAKINLVRGELNRLAQG